MNAPPSFSRHDGRRSVPDVSWRLLLALAASGCASTQHQLARKDTSDVVPLNLTSRRASASATLHTLIDPKGPGSWKHEAFWDEIVISIANEGRLPLRVEGATLEGGHGYAHSPGRDPWALEELGRGGLAVRPRASIAGRIPPGYVVPTSIALAGTSTVYGSIGLKGPAIVYGAAAVGLPLYVLASAVADEKGRHGIEAEFHRRRLALPTEIEPGQTAAGSLFFPVTPELRRLVLRCRTGDQQRVIEFDLTPFAHLYHQQ